MPTPADTWEEMEDRAGQYARRAEDAVAHVTLREVDTQRAHALATVSLAYSRLAAVRRDREGTAPTLYFIGINPPAPRLDIDGDAEFAVTMGKDRVREPLVFTDWEQARRTARELNQEHPQHTYIVHPLSLRVGGQ